MTHLSIPQSTPTICPFTPQTTLAAAAPVVSAFTNYQDGGLKCWGRSEGGQLGSEDILTVGDDPDEMDAALPTVDLGSGETAVEVSTASSHTCALLGSGGVKCWGKAFFGNLGLEDFRAK